MPREKKKFPKEVITSRRKVDGTDWKRDKAGKYLPQKHKDLSSLPKVLVKTGCNDSSLYL